MSSSSESQSDPQSSSAVKSSTDHSVTESVALEDKSYPKDVPKSKVHFEGYLNINEPVTSDLPSNQRKSEISSSVESPSESFKRIESGRQIRPSLGFDKIATCKTNKTSLEYREELIAYLQRKIEQRSTIEEVKAKEIQQTMEHLFKIPPDFEQAKRRGNAHKVRLNNEGVDPLKHTCI